MCYELSSSLLEPPYETGPVLLAPFDECRETLGKPQGLPEPGSSRSSSQPIPRWTTLRPASCDSELWSEPDVLKYQKLMDKFSGTELKLGFAEMFIISGLTRQASWSWKRPFKDACWCFVFAPETNWSSVICTLEKAIGRPSRLRIISVQCTQGWSSWPACWTRFLKVG